MLYKPDIVEMCGTYDHSIKIPFTLTMAWYQKVYATIYNGCGLVIRENAFIQFLDPLETCALAGGQNCELIPDASFKFTRTFKSW